MTFRILHGDCREVMAAMDADSVDAIVCDPPYGLEFMGKDWDRLGGGIEAITDADSFAWQRKGSLPFGGGGQRVRYGKSAASAQAWHEAWAREALRVLKPGGHLLAFGGTRTFHRLACAIEDAGFEIRDTIGHLYAAAPVLLWCYGSGFPKSKNVSADPSVCQCVRDVPLPASEERAEVLQPEVRERGSAGEPREVLSSLRRQAVGVWPLCPRCRKPVVPAGLGTALKPAFEPIILARKPLAERNVAANVVKHGTGAINVDACRIEGAPPSVPQPAFNSPTGKIYGFKSGEGRNGEMSQASGRWPANLTLSHTPECREVGTRRVKASAPASGPSLVGESVSVARGKFNSTSATPNYADADGMETVTAWECAEGCPLAMLDAQSGECRTNGNLKATPSGGIFSNLKATPSGGIFSPGAPKLNTVPIDYGDTGGASRFFYCAKADTSERGDGNNHPTVKPVELMRWLCRLITPPGGTVLDPFAGSGSTGIAATREGFDFVGIEQDVAYVEIAKRRIVDDCPLFNRPKAPT